MDKSVKSVMSAVEGVLEEDAKLSDALYLMRHKKLSCVIVCNGGKPIGIVTERDVVHAFALAIEKNKLEDIPIAELMTRHPSCIEETMSIVDALVLARSRNIRHLPVVNQQQTLVGLLAHKDTVEAYLQSSENNEKLREVNDVLQLMSLEDPLLNIGNRRALKMDLQQAEASAKRYNEPYTIAMFDIDFFKKYNDEYGHLAGDKTLKTVSSIIKTNIRQTDRVYRYGGEEFLLLMPNIDTNGGLKLADRIRECIENESIVHIKSPYKKVTVSGGVYSSVGDWKTAIEHADTALYKSKDNGRNKVSS